jgi:hypothetical protein
MIDAVAHSSNGLDAAADIDIDRSDDDRTFFRTEQTGLATLLGQLVGAQRAVEDHDRDVGTRLQVRVVMGDKVLDRGVESGNTLAKNGLKGKSGLGADHVFGQRVTELTEEKLEEEPRAVKKAVGRMNDVADFVGKQEVIKDLTRRADTQQGCLDQRKAGRDTRDALVSTRDRLVVECAEALAALEGRLLSRFPRQKDYVRKFFLDVSPEKNSKKKAPEGGTTTGGAKDGAATAKDTGAPAKDAGAPATGAGADAGGTQGG